ncbi:MAG: hypothetical protein WCI43_06195 [Candidatus Firestonebacteria bacterium]
MITSLIIFAAVNIILWIWVAVVPTFAFSPKWFPESARGMAPFPGIVLVGLNWRKDESVLAHELHHQVQMKRYSPLGVAILLGWQYIVGIIRGKRGRALYRSIPLEAEAFENMDKPITRKYVKFY